MRFIASYYPDVLAPKRKSKPGQAPRLNQGVRNYAGCKGGRVRNGSTYNMGRSKVEPIRALDIYADTFEEAISIAQNIAATKGYGGFDLRKAAGPVAPYAAHLVAKAKDATLKARRLGEVKAMTPSAKRRHLRKLGELRRQREQRKQSATPSTPDILLAGKRDRAQPIAK